MCRRVSGSPWGITLAWVMRGYGSPKTNPAERCLSPGRPQIFRHSTAARPSIRVPDLPGAESELSARTDLEGCHRSPALRRDATGGRRTSCRFTPWFISQAEARVGRRPTPRGAHPPSGAVFRALAENRRGTNACEVFATAVQAAKLLDARAQPATSEGG